MRGSMEFEVEDFCEEGRLQTGLEDLIADEIPGWIHLTRPGID